MKNHTNDLMKRTLVFLFFTAVLALRAEAQSAPEQSETKDFIFSPQKEMVYVAIGYPAGIGLPSLDNYNVEGTSASFAVGYERGVKQLAEGLLLSIYAELDWAAFRSVSDKRSLPFSDDSAQNRFRFLAGAGVHKRLNPNIELYARGAVGASFFPENNGSSSRELKGGFNVSLRVGLSCSLRDNFAVFIDTGTSDIVRGGLALMW